MGALKVIDIHLHQTYLKVKTQTSAFLGSTSCSEKQVSILSVSVLAPPCTDSYRHMQSYSTCAASQFNANLSCRNIYAMSIWKVVLSCMRIVDKGKCDSCRFIWQAATAAVLSCSHMSLSSTRIQKGTTLHLYMGSQGSQMSFSSVWIHEGMSTSLLVFSEYELELIMVETSGYLEKFRQGQDFFGVDLIKELFLRSQNVWQITISWQLTPISIIHPDTTDQHLPENVGLLGANLEYILRCMQSLQDRIEVIKALCTRSEYFQR